MTTKFTLNIEFVPGDRDYKFASQIARKTRFRLAARGVHFPAVSAPSNLPPESKDSDGGKGEEGLISVRGSN
jgi:hypothetical protein